MRITWAERNCCADHQQNVEGCVETDIKELGWCLDDIFIGHKNLSVIALIRTSLQQNGWFSWALECFLEAVADLVCVALSGDTPPPKKVHHAFGWRLLPLPQNTPCIMIVTTNHYFFTLWCYFGQWGGGGLCGNDNGAGSCPRQKHRRAKSLILAAPLSTVRPK